VDAAVRAALPVAGTFEVYEVASIPFRGDAANLTEWVRLVD
jgi:hypothetical protein